MRERGVAFVCAMLFVFGVVLAAYWLLGSELDTAWMVCGIGLIVFLVSRVQILTRFV